MEGVETGHGRGPSGAVLIVDDHPAFAGPLARSFRVLGYDAWLEQGLAGALAAVQVVRPELAVMELEVDRVSNLERLKDFWTLAPQMEVAIVTAYPSVVTAMRAIRLGASAYLPKPTTASLILRALGREPGRHHQRQGQDAATCRGTATASDLDRIIANYLSQVFEICGSMSEAARRLKLDRRSLRRMLIKGGTLPQNEG
jgi:two-component system response regulator RegA